MTADDWSPEPPFDPYLDELSRPASALQDDEAQQIAADYQTIDWHKLWGNTPDDVEWIIDPLIERGRSVAMYSPAKTGKSLLTLEIAAALATGRPVLGNPAQDPMDVVYTDLENTDRDIKERLSDLGYGPGDLTNLHYLSFPSLPALDSKEGGRHLLAIAVAHKAAVVVIDTVSRVIDGPENDADTFRALYRHTHLGLKARGIAVLRLDHSGKQLDRGQRGSSSKRDDVDSVWLLISRGSDRLTLKREASRSQHGEDHVELLRQTDPLRHVVIDTDDIAPEVLTLVAELDRLDVPINVGRPTAKRALEAAGVPAKTSHLALAIKRRKTADGLSPDLFTADTAKTTDTPVPETVPARSEHVRDSRNSPDPVPADATVPNCPPPLVGQGDRQRTCTQCGQAMTTVEDGQTTHPGCTP